MLREGAEEAIEHIGDVIDGNLREKLLNSTINQKSKLDHRGFEYSDAA